MARILLPFFLFLAAASLSVGIDILEPKLNTAWGYGFVGFAGLFFLVAIAIITVQWLQRPRIRFKETQHDEWVHVGIINLRRSVIGVERARRARVESTLDGVIHTMRWQAVSLSEPPEFLDLEGGQEKLVPILLQPDADKHIYGVDVKRGERIFTKGSFYVLGRHDAEKNVMRISKDVRSLVFGIRVHYEGGSTKPAYFELTFSPREEGKLPLLNLKKVG